MSKKKRKQRVAGTKVRPVADKHRLLCMFVGDSDDPVVGVRYDGRSHTHRRDSGYRLFTSSAPEPEDVDDDDLSTMCLDCTAKAHPEAVRGMTLARAYELAWWNEDEGEWVALDEDGNEVVFDSGDEPIPGQMTVDEVLGEDDGAQP